MRYWLLSLLGIAVVAASLAAAVSSLYWLLLVGTCASGGPYEIARECPDGTTARALLLTAGIFGVMIGLGLFTARGYRGGQRAAIGRATWVLGFAALGATFLYAGFGPDTPDDSSGWKIFSGLMGVFFLLFTVPVLVAGRVTKKAFGSPAGASMATLADRLRQVKDRK